jgi:hypothetical protein
MSKKNGTEQKPEGKGNGDNMTTIKECMDVARKDGYSLNFYISSSKLHGEGLNSAYDPLEVTISNFYRFEGESDPADEAILYLIETFDGKRGILIDGYGVYGNTSIDAFVQQVMSIQKVNKDEKRPN